MSLDKYGTAIIAAVIAIIVLVGIMITTIKPGYVGVVYSPNGGIKDEALTQGWHLVSPFNSVSKYSIATEQAFLSKNEREGSETDESFVVPTADGKLVNIDIEFSYHFDAERITQTFTKFRGRDGKDIENTFMRGKIKTWVSEVTSRFNVLDIYGNKRTDLNTAAFIYIRDKFEPFGIIIESVNISRIALDAATDKAIQARVNSQQELERQKIEAEKAKIAAERMRIEAEGVKQVELIQAQTAADARRIQAEGEAKAILIRAEAEAASNKKLSETVTPNLLQLKQIEKWSGGVPQVTTSATPFVTIKQ